MASHKNLAPNLPQVWKKTVHNNASRREQLMLVFLSVSIIYIMYMVIILYQPLLIVKPGTVLLDNI